MRSAYDHPEVIESYLPKEVGLQRIIPIPHHLPLPFPPSASAHFVSSPNTASQTNGV